MIRVQSSHFSMDKKSKHNPVQVRYCRVQVKCHVYTRESGITSRDFSTDPSQRRGGYRSVFVLQSFVKCRNCCLVVRFFQIDDCSCILGPECVSKGHCWGISSLSSLCASSCQLREEKGRWDVCRIPNS